MQFIAVEFFLTLLWFILVLSFIVFIHELGHFLPARYYGIKVDTFSIGFGREIFGWNDAKGTRWKLSWIPLGGYVKFFGDADAASTSIDSGIDPKDKSLCLHYRPVKERIVVSFGGPAANYILAIALFFLAFYFAGQPGLSSKIESFTDDSPAKEAGLLIGDELRTINGQIVASSPDITRVMETLTSAVVNLEVQRNGQLQNYIFLANTLKDGDKERFVLGIKIAPSPPFELINSLKSAFVYPFHISWTTLLAIKNMILKTNMDGLGGPIAIAKGIKKAADMGIFVIVFYAALISTSLGIFNLLPIPMLDGGHLLFYLIEAIRGKPVHEKVQEWAFMIGFGFLILLLLLVTYKDMFFK